MPKGQLNLYRADPALARLAALDDTLAQVEAELQRHPAAFPELVVTSSEKGRGIATLRAIIAGLGDV